MTRLLVALLILICGVSKARAEVPDVAGNWVMHLYIGKQLFDDQVHIEKDKDGKLSGKLTVPKRFTSALRNIKVDEKTISFEVEANEGRGPVHFRYEGTFHPTGKTFVGFATVVEKDVLMGGFVGQKL